MSWKVHVIIDTKDEASLPAGVTTLKTLHVGFPGCEVIVHDTCRHQEQTKWVRNWCKENGAIYSSAKGQFKQAYMIAEEIMRRASQPSVYCWGDLVFYEDMRNTPCPRWFTGYLRPTRDAAPHPMFPDHRVIKEADFSKSLLFVKEMKAVQKRILQLNEAFEDQTIWQYVRVIRDGVIYEQPNGMTYEMWKNHGDAFNDETLAKFEQLHHGGFYGDAIERLKARGQDKRADLVLKYSDHALREEWSEIKGARAAGLVS